MRRAASLLALLLCLTGLPVRAQDDPEMAAWKTRLEEAETAVSSAEARHKSATANYTFMRHDRSARGDAKAKIVTEYTQSEHALMDARAHLDALREQARRAGVPPAWIYKDPPADGEGE
jgi:hypothetical protein